MIEGDAVPRDLIPRLVALHPDGRLPVEKLIRRYDSVTSTPRSPTWRAGKTVKPVLEFDLNSV